MLKMCVMVSGGGTNLQAIKDKIDQGYIKNCQISTVISSKKDVYALKRAKTYNIPSKVISRKEFSDEKLYDRALLDYFEEFNIDFIVLAGFLSLLGKGVIKKYKNKIINVHPSLIPSFCGTGYYGIIPHRKVLEYGSKITGATVHFVDYEYDSGPIIFQKAVNVLKDDTPQILQKRVMEEAEWVILPKAIKYFTEEKLYIEGRIVKTKG
ncbi:MAG: phosphoribosylglycinamide formyltransferase [Clostridiales bacterium]